MHESPGPIMVLQVRVCTVNWAAFVPPRRKSAASKVPVPVLLRVTFSVLGEAIGVSGNCRVEGAPVTDGAGVMVRGQNLVTKPVPESDALFCS